MGCAMLAALIVLLALPGAAAGEHAAPTVAAKAPPRTVLALRGEGRRDVIVRLRGTTLARLRGRVPLDGRAGAWSFSPDRRRLAIGVGESLGIQLVDVKRMRRTVQVWTRNGEIHVLTWPTTNRIVGVEQAAGLFVVDPLRRRVLLSRRMDGLVYDYDRSGTTLVLLLAPEDRIGPARLALVDTEGRMTTVELSRIRAGSNFGHDEPGFAPELYHPGLALDEEGGRAFVAGSSGDPIAEIELATLAVSYHTPSGSRSWLARLRNWFEPSAAAKSPVASSHRYVRWLGNGLLALSGSDTTPTGPETMTSTPAGLTIVDTRDWSIRMVDASISGFVRTAGMLVAPSDRGGILGFTNTGEQRYEVLPGRRLDVWDALESRVFVAGRGRAPTVHVIDAGTGRLLGSRTSLPRLLHSDFRQ
jgi:hypothetical protein